MLTDRESNGAQQYLKLKGLDRTAFYRVQDRDGAYSGALMMNAGIPLPAGLLEYEALQFTVRKVRDAE